MSRFAVRSLIVLAVLGAALVGARLLVRDEAPVASPAPAAATPPADEPRADARRPGETRKTAAMSTALPAAEAPLKDIYADLQARANRGDTAAATRLYRDINHCAVSRRQGWENTQFPADLAGANIEAMNSLELDGYALQLDAAHAWDETVKLLKSSCAGVDDAMLGGLAGAVARAAQLGDADARACYLARGPGLDSRGFLAHPEQMEAYRRNASALIDAGIAAGDWKTVDLLARAYVPDSPGMLGSLLGADAAKHYRYLKLLRMGQVPTDDNRGKVDLVDQQIADAVNGLTPAQIADADAWAQDTWQKHYAAAPTTSTESWEPCAFPL